MAPKIVTELVQRFDRNKRVYCGSGYNETRLRREFLDPLFEALGWDVDNKRGVSPLYQDVVHEYPTEVDHSQKAADYAFRVGEKVKFFVEAKKPGTRLHDDAAPALQLRRYAYSAGLPLSILTDFEEFAAYDGRVPPKKADAASRARVMYFTYDQYVDAWDEIAAAFSRDAVWSGAFDKFAEENRGGKAEPPDKLFLKLLEGWRDHLARNVANRNREKDLDKFELSGAVQAILDRIIFLRVAEDRGIEDPGRLAALEQGDNVYGRLMELCLEADDVYNSGLFHFRDEKGRATSRDELTPNLSVDDAVLRKIIRELYDSPYEFGVVPVEILGQVYEQFLGKTIWLDGRGVHIDYKPEVRKAKGVYYTPQYIVEYIVKNTVGELLKGCKTPKDAAKLKILDPACGSGSFLLGAYQHLINWHLERYVNDRPEKHEGKVVATPGPGPASWRLTAAAKKDILVNNLFGVDIDPQAVEVTKLSLLLKALEAESRESVGAQTKFLHERILPDLGDNIKCGNSLIGSDYWDFVRDKQEEFFERAEEERRVNPFDWEVEFGDIMKAGGFDAVIGNPPYVRIHNIGFEERRYYLEKFVTPKGQFDLYQLFYEKGLEVLKPAGIFGMITSNKFAITQYGDRLREYLSKRFQIKQIVDVSQERIFLGPSTYPFILLIKKQRPQPENVTTVLKGEEGRILKTYDGKQNNVCPADGRPFDIYDDVVLRKIEEKGKAVLKVKRGKPTAKSLIRKRRKGFIRGLTNKEVQKYHIIDVDQFLNRDETFVIQPGDIVMKKICYSIEAAIPNEYVGAVNTVYIVDPGFVDSRYVLGILNSALLKYYVRKKYAATSMRGGYIEMRVFEIEDLPLIVKTDTTPADLARHDKMVALVEEMLALHKRLAAAKSDADKQRLQRAVAATDRKIDNLVYELYGLTDEEIKIIES